MEVITDSYNNMSTAKLYSELSQKYAQLNKIDQTQEVESVRKKDYIESNHLGKNYDQNDFERVLSKFKAQDSQIRAHEQLHASKGNTTTPISYSYTQGPDGKMYVSGGHVRLDVSMPDDPKAAAFKLNQIKEAASAPSDLSGADNAIATAANLNKMLLQIKGEENAS